MRVDSKSAVLIVIDVQQAFDNPRWGERNNPQAEANIATLVAEWRRTKRPIIHVHHVNPKPESLFNGKGIEVKPEGMPLGGEPVLQKNVNSAFIGTDLQAASGNGRADVGSGWIDDGSLRFDHGANGRQLWIRHLCRFRRDGYF